MAAQRKRKPPQTVHSDIPTLTTLFQHQQHRPFTEAPTLYCTCILHNPHTGTKGSSLEHKLQERGGSVAARLWRGGRACMPCRGMRYKFFASPAASQAHLGLHRRVHAVLNQSSTARLARGNGTSPPFSVETRSLAVLKPQMVTERRIVFIVTRRGCLSLLERARYIDQVVLNLLASDDEALRFFLLQRLGQAQELRNAENIMCVATGENSLQRFEESCQVAPGPFGNLGYLLF